jgi:hypothetical protein
MTTADKLEIDMLFQNINTMKAQSEKMDELYLNKEVIDYATKAFNNAKDVQKYICDIIQKNITLFFDFSKPIALSTHSCCGDYWVNLRDRHRISIPLGSGIQVVVNVKPHLISDFVVETYKASFKTTAEAFDVVDVFTYVNDVNDKDYDIHSEWDLVFLKGGLDSFYTNGTYNTKQRVAVWNCLYSKAKFTRAKTEMMVRFFKKLLADKCAFYKKRIEKTESELEKAKCVDKYTIVTV